MSQLANRDALSNIQESRKTEASRDFRATEDISIILIRNLFSLNEGNTHIISVGASSIINFFFFSTLHQLITYYAEKMGSENAFDLSVCGKMTSLFL